MIKKSILELAWDVLEDVYRADPAASYSILAAFFREGPSIIPHLNDKKNTAALKRGSLVDTLLTDYKEFDNKFIISDITKPPETISQIVETLWNASDKVSNNLDKISDDTILTCANNYNLYPGYKETTRVTKVRDLGSEYFSLLALAEDKTIMSQFEYSQAIACVDTLKTHAYTREYFFDDPFNEEVESYYQLKFKINNNDIAFRIMLDRLIVDHKNKTIQPIDLKTTGKEEEKFDKSYIDWSYWIQSNAYSQVLQEIILQDEYFKDFTILPFKFIVINKDSLSPIVWTDYTNLLSADRIDQYGNVYPYWKTLYHKFIWHVEHQEYHYSYDTCKCGGNRELNSLKIMK